MTIKSARLYFEVLQEKHFKDFLILDMDPDVMKFIRKPSTDETSARIAFNRYIDYSMNTPGFGGFAVYEKDTEAFVGLGVLIHIELKVENEKFEVGYRLGKNFWGKGYATEIAKALIEYGFKDMNLTEIYGTTHPEHKVSQKTLIKAGLKDIGTAPYYNGTKFFRIDRGQS